MGRFDISKLVNGYTIFAMLFIFGAVILMFFMISDIKDHHKNIDKINNCRDLNGAPLIGGLHENRFRICLKRQFVIDIK